ncbi:Cof-type HAD-IIB family hydrolase [Halotalea alkalilenta]|uniref:Haloacid dehalogenase n=1 Tax=Halotalea alkalilenta TaxID=376489 RepID=A0A172YGV1_9GAMM|nr:Cof-type HAD-IIB family hydrolase [Halotalea alkalilenta]ANF58437.1 haloacid dehalogenase [Halotalea alkalilenta]
MNIDALIVSDLDNTLLNTDHRLDPLTIETFQEMERRGAVLAIASGRHYRDIRAVREQLGVDAYIISTNGAHLYDRRDRLVSERLLPATLVHDLTLLDKPDSVRLNVYTGSGWLIDAPDQRLLAFHHSTGFVYEVDPALRGKARDDVGKVLFIGDPSELAPIEREVRERFGGQAHVTYSLPDSLEVMARDVNKGRALGVLLEILGMTPAQCVAFGDNLNDVEMLELAEGACVMENANPLLFEALPHAKVIGHHDQAGVARELRSRFALD